MLHHFKTPISDTASARDMGLVFSTYPA